jgi:hypothetical protein
LFQSNKRVWMLRDDLFGDDVIGLRFQPSLSLLDALQTSFRAASALRLASVYGVVRNGWLDVVPVSLDERLPCLSRWMLLRDSVYRHLRRQPRSVVHKLAQVRQSLRKLHFRKALRHTTGGCSFQDMGNL